MTSEIMHFINIQQIIYQQKNRAINNHFTTIHQIHVMARYIKKNNLSKYICIINVINMERTIYQIIIIIII